MKVIYIAGPFRAENAWLIEQNIRRAEEMAFHVAALGGCPLCPHTNTRFFNGTITDEHWLECGMELLRRSDAVMLVEGWGRSHGAVAEVAEAQRLRLPVFDTARLADLERWLSPQEVLR